MVKEVQFRRGSTSDHTVGVGFTGVIAEVTVDTTNNTLRVHDGSAKGGHELVGVAATQRLTNKDIEATTFSVGVGTITTLSSTDIASSNLNLSGISTLGTVSSLNVSGLSTFSGTTEVKNSSFKVTNSTVPTQYLQITQKTDSSVELDKVGSGAFNIRGNNIYLQDDGTGETYAGFEANGKCYLNYDNDTKIETTGAGVTVTGNVDVSGDVTFFGNLVSTGGGSLFGIPSVQVLTSGTGATYTPPSGLISAVVIATGAGGGGGGSDCSDTAAAAGGAGGAAGGTSITLYNATEMGANATYTIGAGGNGGTAAGGDGAAGGNTSFTPAGTGTALTANGGSAGGGTRAGNNLAEQSPDGGTSSGGLINIDGGDGEASANANAAELGYGGHGGSSFWGGGGGGGAVVGAGQQVGKDGHAYGSGGGGSTTIDNTTGAVGGAGAAGVVFVLEFVG